jgi:hypothetical protein
MRLTDNRYAQERFQLEVAMRMIRFEARTCTVRTCTGLSEDRVRKLYKSYIAQKRGAQLSRRRRGKSPRQIDTLLRTARTQLQASLLAGTFVTLGLLHSGSRDNHTEINTEIAAKLCDAFEAYASLVPDNELSFEHAWFLWRSLTGESDLYLRPCGDCGGLNLQDRFTIRTRPCPWCGAKHS